MVHGVGQFSLDLPRLQYHTSVVICRLIARTVLIRDSSAIHRLVYASSGVVAKEKQQRQVVLEAVGS